MKSVTPKPSADEPPSVSAADVPAELDNDGPAQVLYPTSACVSGFIFHVLHLR